MSQIAEMTIEELQEVVLEYTARAEDAKTAKTRTKYETLLDEVTAEIERREQEEPIEQKYEVLVDDDGDPIQERFLKDAHKYTWTPNQRQMHSKRMSVAYEPEEVRANLRDSLQKYYANLKAQQAEDEQTIEDVIEML